jgi:hypothetical protein
MTILFVVALQDSARRRAEQHHDIEVRNRLGSGHRYIAERSSAIFHR